MSIKSVIWRLGRYIIKGIPEVKNITASISYTCPSGKLKGKNIIITGGGRGLGYAMAVKFVAEGANVLIAGRNVEKLQDSAEKIGCKYLHLDVQKADTFEHFFIDAEKLLGSYIDCLVNNAGISLHEKSFLDVTPVQFDSQIGTNFRGAFFMTQEYIKRYRANKLSSGKVLFISSETSVTVDERPYGLTKAAINSLVQGLAFRYIKEGIRVNALGPGVTSSDMTGFSSEGNLYYANHATDRIYLPEEMAEMACFLMSDESNLLNGQILICNEGKTINARWK